MFRARHGCARYRRGRYRAGLEFPRRVGFRAVNLAARRGGLSTPAERRPITGQAAVDSSVRWSAVSTTAWSRAPQSAEPPRTCDRRSKRYKRTSNRVRTAPYTGRTGPRAMATVERDPTAEPPDPNEPNESSYMLRDKSALLTKQNITMCAHGSP